MNTRAVAAIVLATVSFSFAFAAGRMSAWIVPVTKAPSAVANSQVEQNSMKDHAAKAAAKSRIVPSSLGVIEAAIGVPNTTAASKSSLAKPREPSRAVALWVADQLLHGMDVAAPAAPKGPVLLNAGSTANDAVAADSNPPIAAGAGPYNPGDIAVAQCGRRFSSFRQSDGTYQPLDSGPRKRCPLLR